MCRYIVDVQQAMQQVATYKAIAEAKRRDVEEAEKRLKEQAVAAQLRTTQQETQQALRSQDIRSRIDVRQNEENVRKIRQNLEVLGEFKAQADRELSNLRSIEDEQAAFDQAKKDFENRVPFTWVNGKERDYLQQMYKDESLSKQYYSNQIKQMQAQLSPGEQLAIGNNGVGIESGAFGASFGIEGYNRQVTSYNNQIPQYTPVPQYQKPQPGVISNQPIPVSLTDITNVPYPTNADILEKNIKPFIKKNLAFLKPVVKSYEGTVNRAQQYLPKANYPIGLNPESPGAKSGKEFSLVYPTMLPSRVIGEAIRQRLPKQSIFNQRVSTDNPFVSFAREVPLFALAAPAMSTGALARVKAKQLLEGRFPEGSLNSEDAGAAIREAYLNHEQSRIRELLQKAYNSGASQEQIKKLEKLIRDTLGQSGRDIIRDVKAQELAPIAKPQIEFNGVGWTKQLPKESFTSSSMAKSSYEGLGQYERTNEVSYHRPAQNMGDILGLRSLPSQKLKPVERSLLSVKSPSMQRQPQSNIQDILGRIKSGQMSKQSSIPKSAFNSMLGLKQPQKFREALKEKLAFKQMQQQRYKNPQKAKRFPIIPWFDEIGGETKLAQKILKSKGFEIFVRRRKKDIKVGEAKTDKEAFSMLFGKLKSNLGASGFVESGGRKVNPRGFDFGFRPSKREQGRVVQENWFRLGSFGERREIQQAKRNRPVKFDLWGTPNKKKRKRSISWW